MKAKFIFKYQINTVYFTNKQTVLSYRLGILKVNNIAQIYIFYL